MALRALYPARARGCGAQRLAALFQVEVAFDRLLLRLVFGQWRRFPHTEMYADQLGESMLEWCEDADV